MVVQIIWLSDSQDTSYLGPQWLRFLSRSQPTAYVETKNRAGNVGRD
jgi:hypothetical protein